MNFDSIEDMRKEGFEGFVAVCELQALECCDVPRSPGVYLVLRTSTVTPEFRSPGTGGPFKNNNPNVKIRCLERKWVDGALVMYIGKAGGKNKSTLRTRLRLYMTFGERKPVAHWGGRYIWQLRDSLDLLVCWKITGNSDPRSAEKKLIREFEEQYGGKRPFANLKR